MSNSNMKKDKHKGRTIDLRLLKKIPDIMEENLNLRDNY